MTALLAAAALAAAGGPLLMRGRPSAQRLAAQCAGQHRSAEAPTAAVRFAAWIQRAKRSRAVDAEAVVVCGALAAGLRAGLTPGEALTAAAADVPTLGPGLTSAARAVGRGAPMGDELAVAGARARCARVSAIAAVCTVGETTGAGMADVLDRLAEGLTADDEARAELDALAAGPRATALVLAGLPLVAVAMASALGLSPLPVLLHSVLGAGLLLTSGGLEVAGLLWVRRITRSATAG